MKHERPGYAPPRDYLDMLMIGALVNSALYVAGAFVAGIVTNNPDAWRCALLTAALCYLAYVSQISGARFMSAFFVFGSIFAGLAAGVFLLFR